MRIEIMIDKEQKIFLRAVIFISFINSVLAVISRD